jgi:hypothetical protein
MYCRQFNVAAVCVMTASMVYWSAFLATDPEVRVRFLVLPDFFGEVVGLQRGPLSLVMIIEELFRGNSSSSLENRN